MKMSITACVHKLKGNKFDKIQQQSKINNSDLQKKILTIKVQPKKTERMRL